MIKIIQRYNGSAEFFFFGGNIKSISQLRNEKPTSIQSLRLQTTQYIFKNFVIQVQSENNKYTQIDIYSVLRD